MLKLTAIFISCFSLLSCSQPSVSSRTEIESVSALKAESDRYEKVIDREITSVISNKLYSERLFSPEEVQIKTQDGIVTLSGTVDNLFEKDRARYTATSVQGVRSIVNLLKVRPTIRTDQEIRSDVMSVFRLDPTIDTDQFSVNLKDGIVYLYGTAGSWAERALVETAAGQVPGVQGIQNYIQVAIQFVRPDSEIQKDILGRLKTDPWIAEEQVVIQVRAGHVILSGSVGSLAAKERLEANAHISGVRSVDTRQVSVVPETAQRLLREDAFALKPNDQVKDAIEDALKLDPRLDGSSVQVSVNSGVVTLKGDVPNLRAKKAIEGTAWNTRGVVEVLNRMIVRPPSARADAKLERDIASSLRFECSGLSLAY